MAHKSAHRNSAVRSLCASPLALNGWQCTPYFLPAGSAITCDVTITDIRSEYRRLHEAPAAVTGYKVSGRVSGVGGASGNEAFE